MLSWGGEGFYIGGGLVEGWVTERGFFYYLLFNNDVGNNKNSNISNDGWLILFWDEKENESYFE